MKQSSLSSVNLHSIKREKKKLAISKLPPIFFYSIAVASLFFSFLFFYPNQFKIALKKNADQKQNIVVETHDEIIPKTEEVDQKKSISEIGEHRENIDQKLTISDQDQNSEGNSQKQETLAPNRIDYDCDLFKGGWVRDTKGSLYTNWSCQTIPDTKNCFKNEREDSDFLKWRWKPDKCELPRFDPKLFLEMVQGKTLAFIGDSVARNHMESLLCLLSMEEAPTFMSKNTEEDRFPVYHFPHHSFTLMVIWSKFLVESHERSADGKNTGVFDMHLDKPDRDWADKLPIIDFAVISSGHWFFRQIFLHQGRKTTGCIYCSKPNLQARGLEFAYRMSYRTTLQHINRCNKCGRTVTLVRTFSPSHFEGGAWDTGGHCNKTRPLDESEVKLEGNELVFRNIQVEETERAKREGRRTGKRFGVLDVSWMMRRRPDGHPGSHWGNKWMKGYDDCVHWCLPGPVDVWSDLMLAVLQKETNFSPL